MKITTESAFKIGLQVSYKAPAIKIHGEKRKNKCFQKMKTIKIELLVCYSISLLCLKEKKIY